MKMFSGKKNKNGFTTTEVMLVVAILAVVMAIAIPAVVRISRNLKIAKLDDIAREIYTAAQSRAVSLSVSGELSQVECTDAKVPAAGGGYSSDYKCVYKSGMTTTPKTDWDILLPFGSVEEVARSNYFIIEYNPDTAMIKGVYYWEKKTSNFYADPAKGYATHPEDRKVRMKYDGMVGYYDGSDVDGRLVYTGPVEAELINEEELYLKIIQGVGGDHLALNGIITVTLTDLDTNNSMKIASFNNNLSDGVNVSIGVSGEFAINTGENFYGSNLQYVSATPASYYKLTLDSLNAKLRFSKIMDAFKGHYEVQGESYDANDFHPGCNLRVTVSFKEAEGDEVQEESFLTNSLFASVKGNYDINPLTADRTALIAYGRHLENLGLPWVYQDKVSSADQSLGTTYMSDNLNGVTYAEQTQDIDWHTSLQAVGITDPADKSFKPIINVNLKEFNGGGNTISHVDIYGDANGLLSETYGSYQDGNVGVGLFSRFEKEKLENINLVDCTVKDLEYTGTGELHVGLLAGMIEGEACTVLKCHAYAEVAEDKQLDEKFEKCSITAPSAKSVGGLFGYITKTNTINDSSASLTKITGGSSTNVGGLAGQINCESTVNVSKCYADTGVWSLTGSWVSGLSGNTVGGLVGAISIDGSGSFTMDHSYAVGGVSGSSGTYYGLVGNGSGTFTKCYAALMKGYSIVKDLVPAPSTITGCPQYNGGNDDFNSLINDGTFVKANGNSTHPYGLFNKSKKAVYPFPRLKDMPHYGDWPQPEVFMAYFELYQHNNGAYSIGFYNGNVDALRKEREEGENTPQPNTYPLQNDENYTVVMDGYAVMLPLNDEGKYDTYNVEDLIAGGETASKKLVVEYNDDPVNANNLKLMNAEKKFVGKMPNNITGNKITINMGGSTTKSYYPLFLSSAMMVEGNTTANQQTEANSGKNALAKHDSYYQKLEVQIKSTEPADPAGSTDHNDNIIAVYFNPYVAKSDFVKVEKKDDGTDENPPETPGLSIMRTSRQITAYSYNAMKNTAIGDLNKGKTHTLKLERNITLNDDKIQTDSTIGGGITCGQLIIPKKDTANVILELNGKTLTDTRKDRAVTCLGGKFEVYGFMEKDKDGKKYDHPVEKGTINGGGILMKDGVKGTLNNVNIEYIKGRITDGTSVNMGKDVTLEGCTITEKDDDTATAAAMTE